MKKLISIFIVFALIFTFASCKNDAQNETTTQNNTETTTYFSSELVAPEKVTQEQATLVETEETTEKPFTFNSETAVSLGDITSEIYGSLSLFYQDDKIIIFDEYKDSKFILDANGYATNRVINEISAEGIDLNFDGYTDFMLLYNETEFNTYYFCWLWNMDTKSFEYYAPLSSIPSPQIEEETSTILSLNRTDAINMIVTTYKWVENELVIQSYKQVTDEQQSVSSEAVDTEITFTQGGYSSEISLYGNVGSSSQWLFKIEDSNVLSLLSSDFNEADAKYTFSVIGVDKGTTTVVFRYAVSWEADFVEEKILNITVGDDYTLSIVEIE